MSSNKPLREHFFDGCAGRPCMECGECSYNLAYGEPETSTEENEAILKHCRDCMMPTKAVIAEALADFAARLSAYYRSSRYKPTPKDPFRHTSIDLLFEVIQDTFEDCYKTYCE